MISTEDQFSGGNFKQSFKRAFKESSYIRIHLDDEDGAKVDG